MKRIILFFCSVILFTIVLTSCKKSEDSPTTLQRIQAKWSIEKEYYHDKYGGIETRDTTIGVSTDYVDFRTDGKVYFKFGGTLDTASYTVLGDTKIITTYSGSGFSTYSDTAQILLLNDNQLQTYVKEFDPAPDYYEYSDYLFK
jgi:hypothetical protein